MTWIRSLLGPRVPLDELSARPGRYLTPSFLFAAARVALLAAVFLPFWQIRVEAPQYPDGLRISVYLNHAAGDVNEVDLLNHYIGMRSLTEAAPLERSVSIAALVALVLMIEAAQYVHTRWTLLLCVPAVVFPAFFLADLHYWLVAFGQHLDPSAPLSAAVKPFTPPLLGDGHIGQFATQASVGPGLWLAATAAILTLAGLWFHRRAFKPLSERPRIRPAAVRPDILPVS